MKIIKLTLLSTTLFLGTQQIIFAAATEKQAVGAVHVAQDQRKPGSEPPSEKKAKEARHYADEARNLAMQAEKTAKLAQMNLDKAQMLLKESQQMRQDENKKVGKETTAISGKTGGKVKTKMSTATAKVAEKAQGVATSLEEKGDDQVVGKREQKIASQKTAMQKDASVAKNVQEIELTTKEGAAQKVQGKMTDLTDSDTE